MMDLKKLWEETEEFVHQHEEEIATRYIYFLREVAKDYILRGRRVFFSENRVVHYGEGGFGHLLIECDDEECNGFGTYVHEIEFKKNLSERDIRGYSEITMRSLEKIGYKVD